MPYDPRDYSIYSYSRVLQDEKLSVLFKAFVHAAIHKEDLTSTLNALNIQSDGYTQVISNEDESEFHAIKQFAAIHMNTSIKDPTTDEASPTFYIFMPHSYNSISLPLKEGHHIQADKADFVSQCIHVGVWGTGPYPALYAPTAEDAAMPEDFSPDIHSYVKNSTQPMR